ncbi:MAG TPA: hypothetical protein VIW24_32550 [Aldersonia sp.]
MANSNGAGESIMFVGCTDPGCALLGEFAVHSFTGPAGLWHDVNPQQ